MKRRKFLKIAGLSAVPVLFGNMLLPGCNAGNLDPAIVGDRVLVLLQLLGGNDGLNTLVPLEQYDRYKELRPDVGLALKGNHSLITLDSGLSPNQQTGLHPSFGAMKELYEMGKVNIVRATGYPNPNKSHFKSTDIWLRMEDGVSSAHKSTAGWMANYLDADPYLNGSQAQMSCHPPGIQFGSRMPSPGFHKDEGAPISVNLTGQDPEGFYTQITGLGSVPPPSIPNSRYGRKIDYILNVEKSLNNYSECISNCFQQGSNGAEYPDTELAGQLKTIVRLISGGIKTKIFLTVLGDFDHHADQVLSGESHLGKHASLLSTMGEALLAFNKDLEAMGLADRVLLTTFSEFGRKPLQNGNLGTDHGTIAPIFMVGNNVAGGMIGENPNLSALAPSGHFGKFQYDYREVFSDILQNWLGADENALKHTGLEAFKASNLSLIS